MALAARLCAWALAFLPLLGCQSTPITGSRAFNAFSVHEDVEIGRQGYAEVLQGQRIVGSGPQAEMVRRVMSRITSVSDDPGFEWEVTLIDDPKTVNAFAMPGGKMAVYTGILPVCGDETGLAVVMGHEIGHVIARHGTQQLTSNLAVQALLSAVEPDYQELGSIAAQLTFSLPFSRHHESEADHIGLVYMARAGYDPRTAVEFWSRMAAGGGGGAPEWLSTHPSDETRIRDLERLMPEALSGFPGGAKEP
jgi:predicted Zn-dependent protease